jgi:hypothetical protein
MLKISVDGKDYEYNQSKLMASEASMVQRYLGRTVQEWTKGLDAGDVDCITALVWLIYKRDGQTVAFKDVDYDLGSFDMVELDAEAEEEAQAEDENSVDPLKPLSGEASGEVSETS